MFLKSVDDELKKNAISFDLQKILNHQFKCRYEKKIPGQHTFLFTTVFLNERKMRSL